MDRKKAIEHIEKYKAISHLLDLKEDELLWDEIIKFINSVRISSYSFTLQGQQRKYHYEKDFKELIQNNLNNLEDYDIDVRIVENKDSLVPFWRGLDKAQKEAFLVFELNVILYMMAKRFDKYRSRDKRKLLQMLDFVAFNETYR